MKLQSALDGTKVYVTNYGDINVSVIDAATNNVIASVTCRKIFLEELQSPRMEQKYM